MDCLLEQGGSGTVLCLGPKAGCGCLITPDTYTARRRQPHNPEGCHGLVELTFEYILDGNLSAS